jgi:hypothetical protein
MKIVIQNRTTGDYVGASGKWTSHPDQSFDFEKTMLAFQYCRDRNLRYVSIVLKFEDSQYDIPLSFDCPVSDKSSRKVVQRKRNKTYGSLPRPAPPLIA